MFLTTSSGVLSASQLPGFDKIQKTDSGDPELRYVTVIYISKLNFIKKKTKIYMFLTILYIKVKTLHKLTVVLVQVCHTFK